MQTWCGRNLYKKFQNRFGEISKICSDISKVKNIYDMAGNMYEWTTEVGNHSTSETMVAQDKVATAKYAVLRGGSFVDNGKKKTKMQKYQNIK